MIKKIQTKFIAGAMVAVSLVTISIFGVIMFANYTMIDSQLQSIIDLIINNDWKMPEYKQIPEEIASFVTQESQFTTRYFIITINDNGDIVETNFDYISAITQDQASEIIETVLSEDSDEGYYNNYRYKITVSEGNTKVVFLDGSMLLNSFKSTIQKAVIIIIGGLLVVFCILSILSKRILSPMIKSIEKQRQFITNAGHELKTPVAVIMADADVMEMNGNVDKELIASIKNQTRRLNNLIKSLLNLANIEEKNVRVTYTEFSLTETIKDEIAEFKALAQDKEIVYQDNEEILIKADKNSIVQLITILLDNAIKYTPDNGKIEIKAEKQNKNVKMQFSNTCDNAQNIDTRRIFDRFYRQDKSRNKSKEGYGIGLSIAKSIVEMHKGKITATTDKKGSICFTIII